MSKQWRRLCDVCGEEIDLCDGFYKFKRHRLIHGVSITDKFDMCGDCFESFVAFTKLVNSSEEEYDKTMAEAQASKTQMNVRKLMDETPDPNMREISKMFVY